MSAETFFQHAPKTLTPSAKVIGLAMYTFADDDDLFSASLETLMQITGHARNTIRRCLPELITAGVIRRVRCASSRRAATYHLLLPGDHS